MNRLQKDIYFVNRFSFRFDLNKKKEYLWNARCPVCGDSKEKETRKRFFIYKNRHNNLKVHCHNCGLHETVFEFIERMYPDMIDEYKMYGFTPKKNLAEEAKLILNTANDIAATMPSRELFVTDDSFDELTDAINALAASHPARKYVDKRQVPYHLVRYTKNFKDLLLSLHLDEINKRYAIPAMLIPFRRASAKIEIFQARFFDPKIKPKYYTVKLNPDARKIYNQDFIDPSQTVYILEGPIDSMFIDNAIALGGSDGNIEIPNKVWVFDNDKNNHEMQAKISAKIAFGEKVVIWDTRTMYKDINEAIIEYNMTKEEIARTIRSRTFCGLKAKLEFAKSKI